MTATPTCARLTARRCQRLGAIADQYRAVQGKLDNADNGVNPLGLAQDALLFDLDPRAPRRPPARQG